MSSIFIHFLQQNLMVSLIILVVLAARLLLKKAPRMFSYLLWFVVLFRLICPFSFSSNLSILNILSSGRPSNTVAGSDSINAYTAYRPDTILATVAESQTANINMGLNGLGLLAMIWILGILCLAIYGLYSYIKTKRSVQFALKLKDNIYVTDQISVPFILGIFKPRIYIPSQVETSYHKFIISHEKLHIKRMDHLIKTLFFIAAAAY